LLLFIFPFYECAVVYAQFQAPRISSEASLAFVAFEDANADEETAHLANELSSIFFHTQDYHVVEQKLVRDVLEYHPFSLLEVKVNDAEEKMKQAKEFYYFSQFQDAEILLRSIFSDQTSDSKMSNGALLMEAHLLLALVFKAQHKEDELSMSFQEALKINPFFQLDETLYSPSFRTAFEKERKKIFSGPLGSATIVSDPELALVSINGVVQGATPLSLSAIPSGKYVISLKAEHYKEEARLVEILPEQHYRISTHLQWNFKKRKAASPTKEKNEAESLEQFRFAQHASNTLKLNKLVLLDIDVSSDGKKTALAMVYDGKSKVSFKPIVDSHFLSDAKAKTQLSSNIINLLQLDPLKNPEKSLLALGDASVGILQQTKDRKKQKRKKALWYSIAGAAAVGVISAFASGATTRSGSANANLTNLEVQLKGNGK